MSSDHAVEFTRQHIKQVPDSVHVLDIYNLTVPKITADLCDALKLCHIIYRSHSVARPPTESPTAHTLFMDPQVLPTTPHGFCLSKLRMPRKWVLPFTNAVAEVLFQRQNKRSLLRFVSIFMFSLLLTETVHTW